MTDQDIPQPDCLAGAPHPRETAELFGQDAAQTKFLDAFNTGRLHHGWLITGPRGVGKATFAWRAARFLLAQPKDDGGLFGAPPPPTGLNLPPDHPVMRRTMALAEPGLFLLRRAWREKPAPARLQTVITVDEVRRLKEFFSLTSADGGRRVVIVDSADELNINAANALLKFLEEPPADTTIFLVSHQPARLLPTIRSRCRALPLAPLPPADLARALSQLGLESANSQALAELCGGSVGEAVQLAQQDGLQVYAALVGLFSAAPQFDRTAAHALATTAVGKAGEARFDLLTRLIGLFLSRVAQTGAGNPPAQEAASGEAAALARLCPNVTAARHWAETAQEITAKLQRGRAVNLDPAALILDTIFVINQTAAANAA